RPSRLSIWSGLPFEVLRNCPISCAQGKLVSEYQTGCGAFCQSAIAGLAKSVGGNSKELLGRQTVAASSRTAPAIKTRRPRRAEMEGRRTGFVGAPKKAVWRQPLFLLVWAQAWEVVVFMMITSHQFVSRMYAPLCISTALW